MINKLSRMARRLVNGGKAILAPKTMTKERDIPLFFNNNVLSEGDYDYTLSRLSCGEYVNCRSVYGEWLADD